MAENGNIFRWLLQRFFAGAGAVLFTLAIFLVLPLMQAIGSRDPRDMIVRDVNMAFEEPPPPPPVEEEIEEEEPPEQPPELIEEAPPLDLNQLELALNPGFGDGSIGNFAVNLGQRIAEAQGEDADKIFSLDQLDQKPRVLFQRMPQYPPELRRAKRQGTVYVLFMVDRQGRVVNPSVQKSTDPVFEPYALEAVRQWKFEPGTRNGEKVLFKLRIPITFSAS
jgi:protein TonB